MDFNHFLNSHMLDPTVGGRQVYRDMVDQAVLAERLGYRSVSIPEHHLVNILMVPAPLQLAVRIATLTERVEIVTSVVVLPIHDMRVLAGEVIQAAMLCDDRLVLGVGRGAFAFELARLGVSMDTTRERFDESLQVLEALLTGEEVAWQGKYYSFEPITVMPRPDGPPIPLMLAVLVPEGIYHCARKGYHIQTTPLGASHEILEGQVNAFVRGRDECPAGRPRPRLSLQRGLFAVRDDTHRKRILEQAYAYYQRFDNVYTGPGIVNRGIIEALPRKQTIEELGENLLIATPSELIDRLSVYSELGIDEVIASSNFGQRQEETVEMMQRLSEEVFPHLVEQPLRARA